MKAPFTLDNANSLELDVKTVASVAQTLIDTGEFDDFVAACTEKGLKITASAALINEVKQHLFVKKTFKTNEAAASIIKSETCAKA